MILEPATAARGFRAGYGGSGDFGAGYGGSGILAPAPAVWLQNPRFEEVSGCGMIRSSLIGAWRPWSGGDTSVLTWSFIYRPRIKPVST